MNTFTNNGDLFTQMAQVCDQRDAAVASAKCLGDEVTMQLQDIRRMRMIVANQKRVIDKILKCFHDADLDTIYVNLNDISDMCEKYWNGADAKILRNIAEFIYNTNVVIKTINNGD